MALTVNEQLRDAAIHRQIGLTRYSNGLVRQVMSLLNRADSELFARLVTAIEAQGPQSFAVQRLDMLLASVRALNAEVYAKVEQALDVGLRDLTVSEVGFQSRLLSTIPPVALPVTPVTVEAVFSAVTSRPFQGRLLKEWAQSMEASRMVRVRDAVRMGIVQQQTTQELVTKIQGTRAAGYADGLLQIDRRAAESVVRTAVSHVAAVSRLAVLEANADLIKGVQWVSTLDDRTSSTCQVRDGLQYTLETHIGIGHDVPWLGGPGQAHWCCRSCSTPVLKSMDELGIAAPDLPKGKRASMNGAVPADTTYGQWFARQTTAIQDGIVGPTRGAMFRKGDITFDKFTNDKGVWLTLKQLQQS